MKVNAIAKPIQQVTKPMSKPRKALLSAVAATALALTPMTTLNAKETVKEKIENVYEKSFGGKIAVLVLGLIGLSGATFGVAKAIEKDWEKECEEKRQQNEARFEEKQRIKKKMLENINRHYDFHIDLAKRKYRHDIPRRNKEIEILEMKRLSDFRKINRHS